MMLTQRTLIEPKSSWPEAICGYDIVSFIQHELLAICLVLTTGAFTFAYLGHHPQG